jgi:acyl-CoA thioester hydrolase
VRLNEKAKDVKSMALITFKGIVYPGQCDAMGHMNTQYYTAAFDPAFWHLLHECGYSTNWITERREGWVDVRHELSFVKELHAGELFQIESHVEKIGTTSLTTRHKLSRIPDGSTCAEILIISVYFDLEARQKKLLPDEVLRGAANFTPQPHYG